MNGRIGHLHHRYHVVNGHDAARPATARLDHLARAHLADTLSETLDQALDGDEGVYVLRQVHARFALRVGETVPDTQLVERWAGHLAGTIVHKLAQTPHDNDSLVRFENHAEYTARFIADLVSGKAWTRWYYTPYQIYRGTDTATTLRNVLHQEIKEQRLSATLSCLHRHGSLDVLLSALGEDTLRELWAHHLGGRTRADPAAIKPIFLSALRLVARLDLWRGSPPQTDLLFYDYLATGPAPVDWRDRQGLATALHTVLHFLADRRLLVWPEQARRAGVVSRLEQALSDMDWLDTDRLRSAVLDLWIEAPQPAHALPVRPVAHSPTPRQRDLLADLAAVLAANPAARRNASLNSPANALRLYALLVAHAPRWADDELATSTIQQLLDAGDCLLTSDDRRAAIHSLRQGNLADALRTLPESRRDRAAVPLKLVANLGDVGLELVETLAGDAPGAAHSPTELTSNARDQRFDRVMNSMPTAVRRQVIGALKILTALAGPGRILLAAIAGRELHLRDVDVALENRSLTTLRHVYHLLLQALTEPAEFAAFLETLPDAEWQQFLEELEELSQIVASNPNLHQVLPYGSSRNQDVDTGDPGQTVSQAEQAQAAVVFNVLNHLLQLRRTTGKQFAHSADAKGGTVDLNTLADMLPGPDRQRLLKVVAELRRIVASSHRVQQILADDSVHKQTVDVTAELLRQFTIAQVFAQVPEVDRSEAHRAFRLLLDVGEPGRELAQALVAGEIRPEDLDLDLHDPASRGIPTNCAGLWLLLRAIQDARLPYLVTAEAYPNQQAVPALALLLVALGLRWAGQRGTTDGAIDRGLATLAGLKHPVTVAALRQAWSAVPTEDHHRFQAALLRILAGQRLVRGTQLHLYRVQLAGQQTVLVAGDESGTVWPLGRFVRDVDVAGVVAAWLDVWQDATGRRPTIIAAAAWADALRSMSDVTIVPAQGDSATGAFDEALVESYWAGYQALLAALAAMQHGQLSVAEADLTIALTAANLLRVWARWLRQFATSSVPYLLENFIRRAGRLSMQVNGILVEMEPLALDVVMEMAGYLSELENVSWLDDQNVQFRMSEQ